MSAARRVLSAAFFLFLSLPGAGAQEPGTALNTAEKLLDAFNRHDPEAMASLVASDFELYYFNDEGVASLASRGRQQFSEDMTRYFTERPTVRSEIVGAIGGPAFVSFREEIVSAPGEQEHRPSSLAVYEVRNSLVKRAWYFPAER